MEARAVTANSGRTAGAGQSRSATLAIMGVTAAIIAAVAFMVNQPAAGAQGVTSVTLTGAAAGEAPTVGKQAPDFAATTIDGETADVAPRAVIDGPEIVIFDIEPADQRDTVVGQCKLLVIAQHRHP